MVSDPDWYGYYPRTKEQSEQALEDFLTRAVEMQLTQGWIGHTSDEVLYPFRESLTSYVGDKITQGLTDRITYDFKQYMEGVGELMVWERVLYYPDDTSHFCNAHVLIKDGQLVLYPHQELLAWFAKRQLKISWMQKRLQQKYASSTNSTS